MKDLIMQALPANPWTLAILLSFVGIFSTIILNVLRPSKKSKYQQESVLPLDETEEVVSHG